MKRRSRISRSLSLFLSPLRKKKNNTTYRGDTASRHLLIDREPIAVLMGSPSCGEVTKHTSPRPGPVKVFLVCLRLAHQGWQDADAVDVLGSDAAGQSVRERERERGRGV